MTTSELSNEFDILFNNISSNKAPGLEPYEKSVLLTQAQEEIIKGLYNGNLVGESFETTEELRRYIEGLVKTEELILIESDFPAMDSRSKFFELPSEVWFITYEQVTVSKESQNKIIKVVPMRQDEWHKSKNNPFKMPNDDKIIRLDSGEGVIELITTYPSISSYLIKYIKRPNPIILEDLPYGLSINEQNTEAGCELNTALHRIILERAVQLAHKIFTQTSV